MKAKLAKPGRVYPAESDPRQVQWMVEMRPMTIDERHAAEHAEFMRANTTEALAREFGPWVKAADGSWFRDRSKVKLRSKRK